jgi:hypothetical protein
MTFEKLSHLEMSLFLKEKLFLPLKYHQIDQKYSVDIFNVVNDYCSWKLNIFYGISTLAYRGPLSATITPVFQLHVVLANTSL